MGTRLNGLAAAALTAGLLMCCGAVLAEEQPEVAVDPIEGNVTQGALRIKTDKGIVECPLKHTDVKAEISGFIARVKVTQTFYNPLDEKIEAVYVFPLPHKAAVDDMTMVIGSRRIVGLIRRRTEARAIYEQALMQGLTASLLEQERPNIFTQSVGNIKPKQEIHIEISYIDVLKYDMGTYEFHFPMVVGPRYIPGQPTSTIPPVPPELKGKVGELDMGKVREGKKRPTGTGWAPDTDRVPDASRITPPVLKPGYRNGHDISLSAGLNAGVPIQGLKAANHKAEIERTGDSEAAIALSPSDSIPNKDFVLRYAVVGKKPEMAVLCHSDETGEGYFMLMIQPKEDERTKKTPPREICFLIDVSGSMSGQPTAKVRDAMQGMLKLCKNQDTIQVITFAGRAAKLFEKAVPATQGNIDTALNFTRGIRGGGGTEMLKGIKMAINDPLNEKRVRIVMMLTDGYIGNEAEIIAEVGRRCGDRIRFWCIGIGSSPNRFLIDGVARQGGGMAKVLGLNDDTQSLVQEVMFRIHRAQLAKIGIDWGNLDVWETYPARIPELWAGRPVIVFGRYYQGGGEFRITISGEIEGEPASWPLDVVFPSYASDNASLAKVWARQKIEDLMHQTYYAGSPEVEEAVTEIALEYRLMSQYTSFVAVDESEAGRIEEPARPPRRMLVPVPIPEGTRFEGFFGLEKEEGGFELALANGFSVSKLRASSRGGSGWGFRMGSGRKMAVRRYGGGVRREVEALRGVSPKGPVPMLGRIPVVGQLFANGHLVWGSEYKQEDVLRSYLMPKDKKYDADWGYTQQALSFEASRLQKLTGRTLKEADKVRKDGHILEARGRYTLAYLLDTACADIGYSSGGRGAAAQRNIEEINKELVKKWTKAVPRLENRLDLVIRDMSVEGALDAVGKAGGLAVTIIPGSLEDACEITRRKTLRVTYLDLRRATSAQALDWILLPVRMTWWVEKGTVVVGTARRSTIESPWVYDVSLVALPSAKKLNKIKDYRKRMDAAKKSADEFIQPVRKELSLDNEAAVWFAPGKVLIFADAKTHTETARLFRDLADRKAKLSKDLAALYSVTSKRAGQRRETSSKMLNMQEKVRVHGALYEYSPRLLAEAAGGDLDLEALTELQIAWKGPEINELLKGPGALTALRSLWAITESSKALPRQSELAALARRAKAMGRRTADEALAALRKSGTDQRNFLAALYAALALQDADFLEKAGPILTSTAGNPGILARVLLGPADEKDNRRLVELVTKKGAAVAGQDMVVLTALACRRAGGDAWEAFRAEAREILGRQALPGSVVVLVNRLSRTKLPLVTAGM